MKLRSHNVIGSMILSLCLFQSAQADIFDVNSTTAGFGVTNGSTYNWLATGLWSDGALAANDAGTASTVTWQGTSTVSEQAYFIGSGTTGQNYTVRLGADGSSTVFAQNIALNVNAAGNGALASTAGNVTIGNSGDTGILTIRSSNSVGAYNGTLTINNGVNLNAQTMNFRGGNVTINGVVSGTGASKITTGGTAFGFSTGPGTLTLANTDNTYVGRVASDFINTNFIVAVTKLANGGQTSSLGTSSANIGINGGTLRYIGSTGAQSTNLGINVASGGATLDASGVTSNDTISITGAHTFTAANQAGNITLTGTNTGNNTLGFAFTDNGTTTTQITKTGVGRWVLNQSNSHTGGTNANGGTLVGSNTGAFGVAGRTINFNAGTVEFATDTSANAYVLNVGSGNNGTVVVNRATSGVNMTHTMGVATIGNSTLNIQQGSNVTGVGTLEFSGITMSAGAAGLATGTMLNPTSGRVLVSGGINRVGSLANLLTLDGTTTGNLISGVIAGTHSLTKSNSSEWELSGANTFSGNTRVTGGKLILTNNLALQNSAFDTSGGGTLDLTTLTTPTLGGLVSSSNFALHSNVTSLTLNVAGNVSFTGNLSGGSSMALTKSGAGTQTLGGTNSYTGLTTVSGGELRITSAGAIGGNNVSVTAGQLTLDGGVTVTGKSITTSGSGTNFFGGLQSVSGTNTWNGNVILGADNARVGARVGATLILSGVVDDGVNNYNFVVRNGNTTNTNGGGNASTITEIAGVNTYGGNTMFVAGLTRLGSGDNRLPTGTVMQFGLAGANAKFDMNGFNQEVAGLAVTSTTNDSSRDWNSNELTNSSATLSTLTVNTATNQTFGVTTTSFTGSSNYTGVITGNIALVKSGASSLTLSATNSYTGGTRVDAGILALTHATNTLFDTGAVNVNGGQLSLGANSDTVGAVTLTSGSITATGSGTLTGSSYDVRSGSVSARLAGAGVGLTKSTSGTVTLSGTNSYTGATSVTAGKLVISSTGSTAAGSAVTVSNAGSELVVDGTLGGALLINSGATLSGSGTISGSATIAGIHNAGNSPGVQTFSGDLGYQAGSTVNWELGGNTTTQTLPAIFDQIVVGGNLSFASTTTVNLLFNTVGSSVDWGNALWDSNQSWTLFDVAGTTTGLENVDLATSNWADSNGTLFNTARNGSFFTLSLSGQDVMLNYTAVPETSVSLLGGLSALLLMRRKRR